MVFMCVGYLQAYEIFSNWPPVLGGAAKW